MLRIIAILLLISFVSASDSSQLWYKAEELYKAKKYTNAKNIYLQISKEQGANGSLYYNLGNSYFRLRDYYHARLYYEKANLLIPNNKSLQHNLSLINNMLKDQELTEKEPLIMAKSFIEHKFSLLSLIYIFMILFTLISLISIAFIKNRKKTYFNILFFLLSITGLLFLVSGSRLLYFANPNQALINVERVEIKSGPDKGLATLFILHKGSKIKIIKKNKKWLNISFNKKLQGWIKRSKVTII